MEEFLNGSLFQTVDRPILNLMEEEVKKKINMELQVQALNAQDGSCANVFRNVVDSMFLCGETINLGRIGVLCTFMRELHYQCKQRHHAHCNREELKNIMVQFVTGKFEHWIKRNRIRRTRLLHNSTLFTIIGVSVAISSLFLLFSM